MNIIGIIPARMASSRFPGKPMAKICGIPMIGHVYFRSKMSKTLDEVYVATCDGEIADYAQAIGAKAIMTKDTHERASDRTAEAMLKIEEQESMETDIVVMIQGDEPMVLPEMIDEAVQPMLNEDSIQVTNLMAPIESKEEHGDPNIVKVVVDRAGSAMYFSREPIPSWRKGATKLPTFKQVAIIPFTREFLLIFNALSPTPLEIAESVDMLRLLENGHKIKMVESKLKTYAVDTIEDLRKVENLMKSDTLLSKYISA